jgi:ankyrin repeat domain-containing protein 50
MVGGRSAPRYQSMATIYPLSKTLQSYMLEYFIVVTDLCHKMLNFTKKVNFLAIDISNFSRELQRKAISN